MGIKALFVTWLYEVSLVEARDLEAYTLELEQACRMLAAQGRAGRAWSREHGYGGYTSYASLDDLPRRASIFEDLKSRLDRHAKVYADGLSLDLGGRRLKLDSMWVNVLKPGAGHTGHIHPHSVISGTVYVA